MFDVSTGRLIRSFGEVGPAVGQLSGCFGVRFSQDGGHILIAESENKRLSKFTLAGDFTRCIGVGTLTGPFDVDFAPNGDIIVADFNSHLLFAFAPDGSSLLYTCGGEGDAPRKFRKPVALAMQGGKIYVLDNASARVQVFSSVRWRGFACGLNYYGCPSISCDIDTQHPSELGARARTLAIRDGSNNKGLAISPDGSVAAVSNRATHKIAVYRLSDGVLQEEYGGSGSGPMQVTHPWKICFNPLNSSNILVADYGNNRVQVSLASPAILDSTVCCPGIVVCRR